MRTLQAFAPRAPRRAAVLLAVLLAAPLAAGTVAAQQAAPASAPAPATPAAAGRRLRIIVTGDLHGSLEPYVDSRGYRSGGMSAMAAVVEAARRECAPPACTALLVDAGDVFSGTPASDLDHGRSAAAAYGFVGYDAAAVGNKEFDWGIDTLSALARAARFPLLAANVRYRDGRRIPGLRADTIIVRGGVRVGLVGVASQLTPETTVPRFVAPLAFEDPAAAIDSAAARLRARGAGVVIALTHTGVRCAKNLYGIGRGTPAEGCAGEAMGAAARLAHPVELLVAGHTHQKADLVVRGTPIVSAAANGRSVAVVDLPLDARGHAAGAPVVELRSVNDNVTAARDAAVDSVVAAAAARAAEFMKRHVADIAEPLVRSGDQYPLGNLITDAQRAAAQTDLAVTNTSGIHADLAAGPATYGAIFAVQPFANLLYTINVRGSALRAYLEHVVEGTRIVRQLSGATVVYDPSRPAGSRIVEVTMTGTGRPLVDSATYSIVMNDYIRTGDAELELAQDAIDITPTGFSDRDALIEYLRLHAQPVGAPAELRFRPVRATPAASAPSGQH